MNRREFRGRGERCDGESDSKSFSSSLLDEIYRSIDDGTDKRSGELKFYRHKMLKKQGKITGKAQSEIGDEDMASLQRALLIEKWIEKKVAEKVSAQRRRSPTECDRKLQQFHDVEEDLLFFSSTSSSSDSSFGGFSSSDTELIYGSKSLTPSCFAKFRPRPVRICISVPPEKTEAKQRQIREKPEIKQRNVLVENEKSNDFDESGLIKSKSRALKIHANLKKVKQPISPGGRLSGFLNSLFTSGNPKKTKNSIASAATAEDQNTERKSKSGQTSTCSSATTFSRSCLSKNSREKLRNGDRTVRFYPVSTIVDEYCRPCGHKSLHEEKIKFQAVEKAQTAESAARKILQDYHQNRKKNDLLAKNSHRTENDQEQEDDDTASCESSDLFELDHLSVIGGDRYREELPVYESTTRINTNRMVCHGY